VAGTNGAQIPLGQVADIKQVSGPAQINSENGLLEVSVLLNARGRDAGSVIADAEKAIQAKVQLPRGYYYNWSGQYESEIRAKKRLQIVMPIAIGIIYILLYFTYRSFLEAAHVLLAVPFALTGGLYLVWLLHYNFSVAVWVGFIALFGTAVQTTVVMVIYLEEAVERKRQKRGTLTPADLREAVMEGALLRLRPKLMTVSTIVAGLLPIFWSSRVGSEVIRPLATPVLGGMLSSLAHVLIVTPIIFLWLRERDLRRSQPPALAFPPVESGQLSNNTP
jgi:Cu(I)/Ag(I) efflux system membrane protein CusA/SilA